MMEMVDMRILDVRAFVRPDSSSGGGTNYAVLAQLGRGIWFKPSSVWIRIPQAAPN